MNRPRLLPGNFSICALGNLVANVAHDLNNLLLVVATHMAVARDKGFNGVQDEVTAVERALRGAASMARGLLSVSRKLPLKRQRLHPGTWIRRSGL